MEISISDFYECHLIGKVRALVYPATRKSANSIDIKITVTPVAKASRSASRRRIGDLPETMIMDSSRSMIMNVTDSLIR
jgi:hypothetical protein